MPDDPGQPGAPLAAAIAELYGGAPQEFTERRAELAAAARSAGDRAAAQAIGALRRPTRAAWVVNRLARSDPAAASRLTELAAGLRDAQRAGNGRRLRALSAERDGVIDALTAQALAAAGVADAPPALRLEITQTLTAALADPEVAADFAAGTLTRAMQWSGFGVLPAPDAPDQARPAGAARPKPADAARARPEDAAHAQPADAAPARPARAARPKPASAAPARPAGAARPKLAEAAGSQPEEAARRRAAQAARRQADETERLARQAAEVAARRREQYAAAERTLACASAAAAEAQAAEDRLEAEVRDLEQRLSQARPRLEAARLRARRAEAAERRARQALDRMPRG